MISFGQVTKRYPGGLEALRGVTLKIDSGEMVFVTGPSGAGKSTLLKLMAAIERPTSGSVIVSGQNVGALRTRAVPYLRRKLGLIFQDQKLLFDRSAFDNVMLPLAVTGFERREAARRVRAALDKVGLLAKERVLPVRLSGGEQQRLAIGRLIGELFRSFNQVGVTVVIATHDEAFALRMKPRHIVLKAGKVAA